MPEGDDLAGGRKKRTITPEELDSLFGGNNGGKSTRTSPNPIYYEDEDEDEVGGAVSSKEEDEETEEEEPRASGESDVAAVMREIIEEAVAASSSSSGQKGRSVSEREEDVGDDESEIPRISSSESELEADDLYMDLDRVLQSSRLRRSVRESISMSESGVSAPPREAGSINNIRTTRYDPTEYSPYDPMKYGAYRRWQPPAATDEEDDRKTKGTRGKAGRSAPKPGAPANRGPSKAKGKDSNKDTFYDALKKLGSAPTSGPTGTGVADPPANKKNVTPNKAPSRKNKRKLITPNDIDSLFARPSTPAQKDEDEDEDDEDDEDEEDEEEDEEADELRRQESDLQLVAGSLSSPASASSSSSSAVQGSAGSSVFGPMDDSVPDWLVQAEKERKESRQATKRAKKQKQLTKDWRFWAAIVVTAGFVSAAWSVYQQTGGANMGGLGGLGGMGPGSGNELII